MITFGLSGHGLSRISFKFVCSTSTSSITVLEQDPFFSVLFSYLGFHPFFFESHCVVILMVQSLTFRTDAHSVSPTVNLKSANERVVGCQTFICHEKQPHVKIVLKSVLSSVKKHKGQEGIWKAENQWQILVYNVEESIVPLILCGGSHRQGGCGCMQPH